MSDAAVILKDVVKRFGNFVAVDRISLEIGSGEIFGFLGPNGAGKSTTIRMLCGLLRPSSGQGWVNGLDIVSQSEQIKSNLGYMSQRFSLYDDLRVEENMAFFGGIYGLDSSACETRIREVLCPDRPRRKDADLSPGNSPPVSSSDWPWGAHCYISLPSSSWMNPPPAWIRGPGATSGI